MQLLASLALAAAAFTWGSLCVAASPAWEDQAALIERFADSLLREADYGRAATEYQRALFVGATGADTVGYKLAVALRLGRDPGGARRALREHVLTSGETRLGRPALFQTCYAWFEEGRAESARAYFSSVAGSGATALRRDARFLEGASAMLIDDWEGARHAYADVVDGVSSTDAMAITSERLLGLADEAAAYERKSPALAAGLSAAVPGLGKLYAGRARDAIASLISVGSMSYLAWRSFDRGGEDSVAGWLYSGAAAVLYAGSVYGSHRAAETANREAARALRSSGLSVFLSYRPGGLGLVGEFRFSSE